MNQVDVPTTLSEDGHLPSYAHSGDAGADLCLTQDLVLAPFERQLVGTGVRIALPQGFAGFIHPRSGLASRQGLSIVNSPGVIDAGYRGEIMVCLINLDSTCDIQLHAGDHIAQLVIQPVTQAVFTVETTLLPSDRGEEGFGSTGGVVAWENMGDHGPDIS
ncbi:MAG: dUTP diphosphatase [Propionibacteriaceae bacterium]|nr:dUTP diphosphatase [Propionibacteriaceae bacterium]